MHTDVEGEALQSLLSTTKGGNGEGDGESTSVCDDGGRMTLKVKVDIHQSISGDIPPEPKKRKQAIYSSE